MSGPSTETCRALLEEAERILCDIDGCLMRGRETVPGATAFVRAFVNKLVLVSNNSADTAATLAPRLAAVGLPVRPERIFLAGEQTLLSLCNERPDAAIMLIATDTIRDLAAGLGLRIVSTKPDLIVLCRSPDLSIGELERALRYVCRDTPLIAANPDLTHPGRCGPAIETGAIAALLKACHPSLMTSFFGKPEPTLFVRALESLPSVRAVMIGDNPDTDIAGAKKMGMMAIQVHPHASQGRTVADLVPHNMLQDSR